MMDEFKRISVGKTTGAIKFGEFYYLLKILDRSKADSPAFEEIRNELEANLKREKIMEESEKFIKRLIDDAKIEYNDEGLEVLLKPDSLITEADLNMWVLKKYDSSFVYVKSIRDAVMYQYRQSFIQPQILIERVLIPDLIYEKALSLQFDKNIKIKRQLTNALGLLIYQKFYSDEVLGKVSVDSMEVVNYYNDHKDELSGQKLNEVFSRIQVQLRDTRIGRMRKEIYEQLRGKYEVVRNQSVIEKLFEEAK